MNCLYRSNTMHISNKKKLIAVYWCAKTEEEQQLIIWVLQTGYRFVDFTLIRTNMNS
jgi:hypothetical protein